MNIANVELRPKQCGMRDGNGGNIIAGTDDPHAKFRQSEQTLGKSVG